MLEEIREFIDNVRRLVDRRLDEVLPAETDPPEVLSKAMRYSVFAGGKRLRPCLVVASAVACSDMDPADPSDTVLDGAAAVEMVHTYSLIHDDLPCMDDDDMRRGRPTNHKVFGEANALLAGDALLTHAFAVLAREKDRAPGRLRAVRVLAEMSGPGGMVGGQVADLEGEMIEPTEEKLLFIHRNKTAKLMTASILVGAYLVGAEKAQVESLQRIGDSTGLAFQNVDDILDVVGNEKEMGKPVGSDSRRRKLTSVSVYGLDGAEREADRRLLDAKKELALFGERGRILEELAEFVVNRRS
jgi:geranylgeranyl diphosphate synthase type II